MSEEFDLDRSEWGRIPYRMREAIQYYIVHYIPPGDFLTAVICNDLREACGRADDENRHLLFEYVKFFYQHAPHQCWGSPEKFRDWLGRRVKD